MNEIKKKKNKNWQRWICLGAGGQGEEVGRTREEGRHWYNSHVSGGDNWVNGVSINGEKRLTVGQQVYFFGMLPVASLWTLSPGSLSLQ